MIKIINKSVCSACLLALLSQPVFAKASLNDQSSPQASKTQLTEEKETAVRSLSTLSIVKTVSQSTATVGHNIVYSLTVTNNSTQDATGIQVIEKLDPMVVHLSDDANGDFNVATGIWNVGALSASSSKTLNITATVQ